MLPVGAAGLANTISGVKGLVQQRAKENPILCVSGPRGSRVQLRKESDNPQTQGVQCHHPRLFRSFLSQAVRSLDASLSVISLRAHSLYSPFPLRLSLDTFSPCLESPPLPAHSRWAVTRKKGDHSGPQLTCHCIPRRFLSTPPQNLPVDSRANGPTSVPNAPPRPPHVCTPAISHGQWQRRHAHGRSLITDQSPINTGAAGPSARLPSIPIVPNPPSGFP